MAARGFSIAKDLSLVLVAPTGTAVTLPKITGFEPEPVYETVKSKVLDGPTIQIEIPDGHNLTIMFDRRDAAVDQLFALIESAYWAAGGFVPFFTLYEYITERDGTQTSFEYTEVTFQYKPGSWKSGSPVSGSIKGFARYKRAVA